MIGEAETLSEREEAELVARLGRAVSAVHPSDALLAGVLGRRDFLRRRRLAARALGAAAVFVLIVGVAALVLSPSSDSARVTAAHETSSGDGPPSQAMVQCLNSRGVALDKRTGFTGGLVLVGPFQNAYVYCAASLGDSRVLGDLDSVVAEATAVHAAASRVSSDAVLQETCDPPFGDADGPVGKRCRYQLDAFEADAEQMRRLTEQRVAELNRQLQVDQQDRADGSGSD